MGFFRILKPFIDLKSQIHTRQIFWGRDIIDFKCRGNRENGMGHKWKGNSFNSPQKII